MLKMHAKHARVKTGDNNSCHCCLFYCEHLQDMNMMRILNSFFPVVSLSEQ